MSQKWSRSLSVLGLAAVLAGCGHSVPGSLFAGVAAQSTLQADAFSQPRAVIRLHFTDRSELEQLDKAGVDLFENVDMAHHTVGATLTAMTESVLKAHGVKYDVMQTPERVSRSPMPKGYHTVDQINADMQALANANPGFVKLVEIGKSLEGRSIFALNITSKPGQGLPAVRINAGQHARELPTVELADRLMHQLVEGYGKDAHITDLVDNRDIWVVPIVNPDGRTKVQQGDDMWRKNTRKLGLGAYGVDTNRNCDDHWSGGDSEKWADDYHGTAPFSEPESQAIRDLCAKEHFKISLDVHNYAGMVLWPPGYTSQVSKDEPTFKAIGSQLADHLGYKAGTIANTIYKTWGDLSTWEYDQFGTLAFGAELNDSGFDADFSEAEKDWNDWSPNFIYLIDRAGNPNAVHPNAASMLPIPTI